MTESLTFRLRNMFACACKEPAEAADRIEKLEAALRFYADHWQKQYHRDLDRVLWNFMNPDDGGKVARKALEGKDD